METMIQMLNRFRPNPAIPDHDVLRKIGGGAYGEVWLARGVTGALRAVKVVWREDFEDERSFEREFEGILKFEPMSRDHPALVNILHVGRSPDGVAFYYYVMELGDDVTSGQEINPIEYEPRTLRADNPQVTGVKWDTSVCIDVGLRLAEALDHLHERGLAHRDVKPSNIIFVNGRAKLADIGLVAARGQRTFVGTEGFVPPEGPGSAQADVYSLGKVLYEIATGKDRMAFPELPDEIPSGADRKRWLELNRIICDICEPRISKRKISSAADLADALRRLQRGKKRRRGRRSAAVAVAVTTLVLGAFASWAGWQMAKESEWLRVLRAPTGLVTPPASLAMLRVVSEPEGADVFDENERFVDRTPTNIFNATVGDDYYFSVRKLGFSELVLEGNVPQSATSEPLALFGSLAKFSPPLMGEQWTDQLKNDYQPVGNAHVSSGLMTKTAWAAFLKANPKYAEGAEFIKVSQSGIATEVVLASDEQASAFCKWLGTAGASTGYLTDSHEVIAKREEFFNHPELSENAQTSDLKPFHVVVQLIDYGKLNLTSVPPGAEVYLNGLAVGSTMEPLQVTKVRPGKSEILFVLEGYKPYTKVIELEEGGVINEAITLEKNEGVVFGKVWENGIEMRFAPLGPDLMVSIWETRVRDYHLFVKESGYRVPRPPDYSQGEDFPIVNISREDAQAFCVWLTERERREGRISQSEVAESHIYRLPTDLEWSTMVGLREDEGISPGWRDARKQREYPWGGSWPPRDGVGNFADVSTSRTSGVPINQTVPGYIDGYPYAAPVGSFPANRYGLYDLSGNAQEWVEDEYSKLGITPLGVLRGGGWNTYRNDNLLSGSRNAVSPKFHDWIYGFRIVLAKVKADSK